MAAYIRCEIHQIQYTMLSAIQLLFSKRPFSLQPCVPAGSPSRGGDVVVYVKGINQPSLPTPLSLSRVLSFSVSLVSVSVFMTPSTVFHSINFPGNSPLSHSVLLVFNSTMMVLSNIYLLMKVSVSPNIIHCG